MQSTGCQVQSAEYKLRSTKCEVQRMHVQAQVAEYRMQNVEWEVRRKVQSAEYQVLTAEHRNTGEQDTGYTRQHTKHKCKVQCVLYKEPDASYRVQGAK